MAARTLGPFDVPGYHVGNSLEMLRHLPDACVHACITSPPYYAMRVYQGVPPTVWGGDPACAHEWGDGMRTHKGGPHGNGQMLNGGRAHVAAQAEAKDIDNGRFCVGCPAWLGCLGLEPDVLLYVDHLVAIMDEVRRVLRPDGTLWINISDSYAGSPRGNRNPDQSSGLTNPSRQDAVARPAVRRTAVRSQGGIKPKDLVGAPWELALALRRAGWWLRSDIIWSKGSCLPESVEDRPTRAHEYVFLLAKSDTYFFDQDAVREPYSGRAAGNPGGRNLRTVWRINAEPTTDAHFAVMPSALARTCIMAGTSERGACPACGAPWERVVEREPQPRAREKRGNPRDGGLTPEHGVDCASMSHRKLDEWRKANPPTMAGWRPTCACGREDTVPCVVLDIFGGSGTTGKVAQDLGRDWLLFDLSDRYADIAGRKTAQTGILAWRPGA